jgi:hypothetical protein
MDQIFKNKLVTAHFGESNKFVHAKFDGLFTTPLAMEYFREMMRFVTKHSVSGFYYDLSQLRGTFTAINDFLRKEYAPYVVKHGVKFVAMQMNEGIFFKSIP